VSFSNEWAEDDTARDAVIAQFKALALDPRSMFRRRWIWMVATLVIGLAATAWVYMSLQPMYAAQATVLVSVQQIPEEFVRSTVSGLDSILNINATAGEILSYNNLRNLIKKHDLYPKEREALEFTEIIDIMRESILVAPEETIGGGRRGQQNSSIFLIEYISANPQHAAIVANELSAGFIELSIRRRNQQARTTTEFMERELARAETEFRDIKAMITEFQEAHRGSMPGDQETILRKLERLEGQRTGMNEQILAEDERLAALRIESAEAGGANPENHLSNLKLELVSQLAINTHEHPNTVTLRRQIRQLENELGSVRKIFARNELAHENRVSAAIRTLSNLRLQVVEISQEMQRLDQRASEIPAVAEAFDALTQNSRVLEEKYLEFLRKVQDAKLAEELERSQQGPRVSVLDHAATPNEPIRSGTRYLQLGIVGTIMMCLMVALFAELIDPTVLSSEHFEYVGNAPVLGSIYSQGQIS
jgi:polysaccharide biosynthesis transport protein